MTGRRHAASAWTFPLLFGLAAVALQLSGDDAGLRYQRELNPQQPWRWLTGQLLHLGWAHLAANLAGLALIAWFTSARQPPGYGFTALVCSTAGVAIGLQLFSPQVDWYVGLSGLEHGWLLAVLLWPGGPPQRADWLLAALIAGKLGYEQLVGAAPLTAGWIGGAVITDAHLYGALGGLLAVGLGVAALKRQR